MISHTSAGFNLVHPHRKEIVFIDRGVEDYGFLIRGIRPGIEIHLLDADAIAQMTTVLSGCRGLKAVHVVSHGSPGCLYLGATKLGLDTLGKYEAHLRSWFAGYGEDEKPGLLLYGCNVAVGDAGAELLDKLHNSTEAGIAASRNITGHASFKGDWALAERRGTVTASTAFVAEVIGRYEYQLNWFQLGQNIDGEAAEDNSGRSVSLSADGTTVAIGAPGNNDAGHVRLYRRNTANQWVQLGQDIDGEAANDGSGSFVSLSADGTTVAIGATGNDGNGNNAGHVRLYRLNALNQWVQLGQDIDGEAAGDNSGRSVSLSADGTTVAIGAPNNNDAGHVRLYRLNASNQWVQLGQDIDGEATGYQAGTSVSLSANGSTVAVGAPASALDGGHMQIYRLSTSNQWVQLGQEIAGGIPIGRFGSSVSLSADGATVSVTSPGAPYYDAYVGRTLTLGQNTKIYRLSASNQWVQLGQTISAGGQGAREPASTFMSLSADGSTVAIELTSEVTLGNRVNHVHLYRLSISNQWVQFGQDIEGHSITSVSLSADGSTVVVGAPFSGGSGSNAGIVQIYNFEDRPSSIVWNTQTGVVSSVALDLTIATASLHPIGRSIPDTNWALQTVGDMDGDGQTDVLLRHATSGSHLVWYMGPGGRSIRSETSIGRNITDDNWSLAGTGDLNGDGKTDIILRNQAADQTVAWYMDGSGNILSEGLVGRGFGDDNWKIEAVADFNGDGKADMLLRNTLADQSILWEMDGSTIVEESLFGRNILDINWKIEGARDFDNNGTVDIWMRHAISGQALLWNMTDENTIGSEVLIANVPGIDSQIFV